MNTQQEKEKRWFEIAARLSYDHAVRERENEFRRRPRPKGKLYCIGVIVFLRLSLCLFRHSTHFSSAVAAVALLFPSFRSFPLRLSGTEIESGPAAKFTMTLLPFAVRPRPPARNRCACFLLSFAVSLLSIPNVGPIWKLVGLFPLN